MSLLSHNIYSSPEDTQSAPLEFVDHTLILGTQQSRHAEFAALDPDPRCFADRLESHHTTIRAGDEPGGVFRVSDGPGVGLEFPVEKLIESFYMQSVSRARSEPKGIHTEGV